MDPAQRLTQQFELERSPVSGWMREDYTWTTEAKATMAAVALFGASHFIAGAFIATSDTDSKPPEWSQCSEWRKHMDVYGTLMAIESILLGAFFYPILKSSAERTARQMRVFSHEEMGLTPLPTQRITASKAKAFGIPAAYLIAYSILVAVTITAYQTCPEGKLGKMVQRGGPPLLDLGALFALCAIPNTLMRMRIACRSR